MHDADPRRSSYAALGVVALAAVMLVAGWWLLWFQCDDAYIAFRYVSNRQLGHGYTWNAPPFQPVEGYTSLLWVLLLDGVWTVLGIEPPESATWLSLLASLGSLGLVAWLAWGLELHGGRWRRVLVLALVLFGTVSNRTFLAWTSSGLETGLFTLLLLAWTAIGLRARPGAAMGAALTGTAALLALCRPDGLLFVAASALWVLGRSLRRRQELVGLLPLTVTGGHLLWRWSTYGAWLPNTYYAKQVAPWPESGAHYLVTFALEYALWTVPLLFVTALLAGRLRPTRRWAVAVVLAAQTGYYVVMVGGDHFEFRVLHHLVPLLLLALVWLGDRLQPRATLPVLVGTLLLGLVIPWTHWGLTHERTEREDTTVLLVPVAPALPRPLSWYAALWDAQQAWSIPRWVGLRHQEHKVYSEHQARVWPTREEGARIQGGNPVLARGGVGRPGWVLPHVAILDRFGLNDFVVARTPKDPDKERRMAHDRRPPEGYLACFRQNVWFNKDTKVEYRPRAQPLTDDEVRACEERFRKSLGRDTTRPPSAGGAW